MSFNNKPNDTAQQLDEIRKARLREAATPPKTNEGDNQQSEEKIDKTLDNGQKNDYINTDDGSNVDEETQKLQNYITNTFDGDELKMAKSLLSSQSEYSKLYNKYQQVEKYKELIEADPVMKEAFGKAQSIEEIKNLLTVQKKESQDKPKEAEQRQSKLSDPIDISTDKLIEMGYIRNSHFEDLTEPEQKAVIRQAKVEYMHNELPNILAEKAAMRTQERIEEMEQQRRKKEQQDAAEAQNIQRYEDGIVAVVEKYGLDFAGNEEDKQMLDEINRRAAFIRDPDNPNVIDTQAVEIATLRVLHAKGRTQEEVQQRNSTVGDKFKGNNFNVNKKQSRPTKEPTTVAEKLAQRRLQRFERDMNHGNPIRKNEVIKIS